MLTIATFFLTAPCAIQEPPASRNRRGQEAHNQEPERALSIEEYRRLEERMRIGVERGLVSEEDAGKRLGQMRRMMKRSDGQQKDKVDSNREGLRRRMDRIEQAVNNGDMTREEAGKLHASLRIRIAESNSKNERPVRTFTREEYAAASEKMNKMVEAGEVSQEDVEKRLIEMRKMVRIEGKSKLEGKSKPSLTLEEYRRIEKRYMAGVKAGKISQEDAERALMEKRKHLICSEEPQKVWVPWNRYQKKSE